MANSFEFIQQRPAIHNALDQAHGLGLDNIAFDTFVDVGDRATIWRTLFSDGILTFESDYKCPFKHIVATIEPVQSGSGDPSPDNVRPISGWTGAEIQGTGKNLLNPNIYDDGAFYSVNADGSITAKATDSRTWDNVPQFYLKPGTYTISRDNTSGIVQGRNILENSWVTYMADGVSNATFTLTKTTLVAFKFCANASSYPVTFNAQLELSSTATAYETYHGSSLSINWQDEAGTVYGGNLAIAEDGSCKLTVDRMAALIGDLEWNFSSTYQRMESALLRDVVKPPESNTKVLKGLMCSAYTPRGAGSTGSSPINGSIGVSTSRAVLVLDTAYTDVDTWITDMGSQQIVYPLATPITYTLPSVTMLSSLLGINNIWASTGGIAVTYKDFNPLFLTDPLNVGVMTLK